MSATFDSFSSIRNKLHAGGLPAPLPWWDDQVGRYYASGAKRFAARVGRGGAKSTTIVEIAINEAVFGDWDIPAGEVHFFAIVSQNKSEAAQRLRQIAERLRILGVPFEQAGDEIVLSEERRGFRVFACQVGSVSGFRCFGLVADELAKWTNADHSANPAPEVVASLRAMTVTHRAAREFFVSSPLAKVDLHYRIIETGSGPDQYVCSAPSWVANNSISEAYTRTLEPDERIWRREYAAIPQDSAAAAFSSEHIERAMRERPRNAQYARPLMAIDPSSGLGDSFASIGSCWCVPNLGEPIDYVPDEIDEHGHSIAGLYVRDSKGKYARDNQGRPIPADPAKLELARKPSIAFFGLEAITGKFYGVLSLDQIVDDLAKRAKRWGARTIVGDAHEQLSIEGRLRNEHKLEFVRIPWTPDRKIAAVMRLRRLMAEGSVILPRDEDLKRELLEFTEKVLPTGAVSFGGRATAKDDRVATILSALMAEAQGLLWSPYRQRNGRARTPEDQL